MNKERVLKPNKLTLNYKTRRLISHCLLGHKQLQKLIPFTKVTNDVVLAFAHMGFKVVDLHVTADYFKVFDAEYRLS